MLGVLDLFAGIGGFSLGLERTGGFKTVAFCEINKKAQLVLKKHWPGVPVYEDIKELSGEKLQADGVAVPHVVTAGWPCQDISTAGRGQGLRGSRSCLWSEAARVIGEVNPEIVVLENSPNLRNRGFEFVLSDLWSLGFDAEWHIIPASAVGAFHQRERLWVIAYAQRLGLSGSREFAPSVHPTPTAFREADRFVDDFLEGSLPFVCGGHDGVSERVDHDAVKCLGNAVVPQITQFIGESILSVIRSTDASHGG
tara:strand:- start:18 stop:779 length:762 start_codon:yes stop_codon:yes gene_type:complete